MALELSGLVVKPFEGAELFRSPQFCFLDSRFQHLNGLVAYTSPPSPRARAHAREYQLGEQVDRHARAANRRIPALLPYRELDDALGLTDTGADRLADARTGKNGRHRLVGLLRQSIFGRRAGYKDVNDADRLCRDPAMRWVVGGKAPMDRAASASQMGRFETEWLAGPENLAALADLPGQWIDAVHKRRQPRVVVLDMDSSESPTYGAKEGSAYNGHFGCTCYHPLFVFNQLGDLERCTLRSGNVHSAASWREVLEPVVACYRGTVKRCCFRGDAAFANPEIYEFTQRRSNGWRRFASAG